MLLEDRSVDMVADAPTDGESNEEYPSDHQAVQA
jgi:hypothetical protein